MNVSIKRKNDNKYKELSLSADWKTVGNITKVGEENVVLHGEMYHYLFTNDNGDRIIISNENKLDL